MPWSFSEQTDCTAVQHTVGKAWAMFALEHLDVAVTSAAHFEVVNGTAGRGAQQPTVYARLVEEMPAGLQPSHLLAFHELEKAYCADLRLRRGLLRDLRRVAAGAAARKLHLLGGRQAPVIEIASWRRLAPLAAGGTGLRGSSESRRLRWGIELCGEAS